MEETLGLRIRASIEELQGGEEFERKLAQLAQSTVQFTQTAGSNIQTETTSPALTQNLDPSEQRRLASLSASFNESLKNIALKFEETFQEFQGEEEWSGLNKGMGKRFSRKFHKLGQEETQREYAIQHELIQEQMRGASPDMRNSLEVLDVAMKEHFDKLGANIDEFGRGVKDYVKGAKDFENSSNGLFEMLRQGGYLAIGQQVLQQGISYLRINEQIEAKEQTAFTFNSPQGMYNEARQAELFRETEERKRDFGLAGGAVGAFVGGMIGLGNPLFMAGGVSIGSSIATQIAEILNIKEKAGVERELKFQNEAYGNIQQNVERARQYEIPATKLSARFGENLRGTSELGYTPEEELRFKAQFGDGLRGFNKETYEQQLTFARARGLELGDISQFNTLTRFTGEQIGVEKIAQAETLAKSIYGENADAKRVVDLLASIKDVTMQQLQLNVKADSREAEKMLLLPQTLFGVDSPYGRMGELGGKTLEVLQGLIKPTSQAHETFLFRYLGEDGIRDFTERLQGGLFKGDNFKRIMEGLQEDVGGNEFKAWAMLRGMMPQAPSGMFDNLSKIVAGQSIDIETEKGTVKDVDLPKLLKMLEDSIKDTGKGQEEILADWKVTAQKNKTQFEEAQERIGNIQLEIGEIWKKVVLDSQVRMSEIHSSWLTSTQTTTSVMRMLDEGFEHLIKKLKEFGIEPRDEWDIKEDAEKAKFREIFKLNQATPALEGESLDEYIERTITKEQIVNPNDGWGSRKMKPKDIKDVLRKRFDEIDEKALQDINDSYEQRGTISPDTREEVIEKLLDKGKDFRAEKLSKLREQPTLKRLGYDVELISGFRSPEKNQEVGGSPNSLHQTGQAFDIQLYKDGKPIDTLSEISRSDALRSALKSFASENNLFWGGDFKDPALRDKELNHFSNNNWSVDKQNEILEPLKKLLFIEDPKLIDRKKDSVIWREEESSSNKKDGTNQEALAGLLEGLKDALAGVNRNAEVTIKFIDTPLPLMEAVQNASIGIDS